MTASNTHGGAHFTHTNLAIARLEEQQLRIDLVRLVNETVAAAIRGHGARVEAHAMAPRTGDDDSPLTRLYRRIGEVAALAVVDHEDSLHSHSATGARLIEAIELDPVLRSRLRRALGVD